MSRIPTTHVASRPSTTKKWLISPSPANETRPTTPPSSTSLWSKPQRGHEWCVFRDRKADIPGDKVLVCGIVDTTTNFVEHHELVAQRIERFKDIAGPERVIAGSDCGFGTFAGFGAVDPDIVYAKLNALAERAALAS